MSGLLIRKITSPLPSIKFNKAKHYLQCSRLLYLDVKCHQGHQCHQCIPAHDNNLCDVWSWLPVRCRPSLVGYVTLR